MHAIALLSLSYIGISFLQQGRNESRAMGSVSGEELKGLGVGIHHGSTRKNQNNKEISDDSDGRGRYGDDGKVEEIARFEFG